MAIVPDEKNYFKALLSCRMDWIVLSNIKKTLAGDNTQKFKDSCFGHFWNVDTLKFQGQLYLHLLFRQDTSESTKKIVFHINNLQSEFGPK